MIITDYLRSEKDPTWDVALACGVKYATIRLPEPSFDYGSDKAWDKLVKGYTDFGFKPIIIEPMPNELHDHIKLGDEKRDWAIENVIKMFPQMQKHGIKMICFNFMAHYGWTRTTSDIIERNGKVTGFDVNDFSGDETEISEEALWDNYRYFLEKVLPYAEKYDVKLALHPDDPPQKKLGKVSRIFISLENINKAVRMFDSDNLGVTFCQASYFTMGENLNNAVETLKDKIFFIHFRNVVGNKDRFHETFHDNGAINMAEMMELYVEKGIDVPIRVDHVPTMEWEKSRNAGYDAVGRLFAIGYMKGLIEATEKQEN